MPQGQKNSICEIQKLNPAEEFKVNFVRGGQTMKILGRGLLVGIFLYRCK